MRPTLTAFDPTDRGLGNVVFSRDHDLLPGVSTDQSDLRLGQLRQSMPFARLARTVANLIGVVSPRGVPSKIRCHAVLSIAIVMRALHSWRLWAEKCFGYKQMNVYASLHAVSPEAHSFVATVFVDELSDELLHNKTSPAEIALASSLFAANAPEAAHRKQALHSNHRTPLFMIIHHAYKYALSSRLSQSAFALKGGY